MSKLSINFYKKRGLDDKDLMRSDGPQFGDGGLQWRFTEYGTGHPASLIEWNFTAESG